MTSGTIVNNPAFNAWFTHTHEPVLIIAADNSIKAANPAAQSLLGLTVLCLPDTKLNQLLQIPERLDPSVPTSTLLYNNSSLAAYFLTLVPMGNSNDDSLLFIHEDIPASSGTQTERDKELLEVTLASISEGVIATDNNSRIIFINQVAANLLGCEPSQAIGMQLFDLFNRSDIPDSNHPLENLLGESISIEFADNIITIIRNNQEKIFANSAATINDRHGNPAGLVMVFRDITEKVLAERQLAYLRFHDKLTGVFNRDYVDSILQDWDSEEMLPLSLILGDVNGLKLTNDVFGHLEGDRLLTQVALIMQEACREQDVVARWGGDEFVIIMPVMAINEARNVCQHINELCEKATADPIKVSIALGVATRINQEVSMDNVFKDAEDQMYQVKLAESEHSRQSIIESIKKSLWVRSQETEDHCSRVEYLMRQMSTVVYLDKRDKQLLSTLAQLHDIGKICIPSDLLSREGPLTPEEWALVRRHPEQGHRIAQAIREIAPIAEGILAHHERWDGAGYPLGLEGNDIPILARMLAIADAYDVMVHDCPYKKSISRTLALEEIKNGAGKQFDPALARIFYELFSRPEINRH